MPAHVLPLAVLTLFLAVSCTTSRDEATSGNGTDAGSPAGAEAAIDSVMARYIAAVERGDTAAIAATLTEDVEIVFPTGPMRKGRADVIRAFAEMFEETTISQLRPLDVQRTIGGDMAVETGAFSITVQPSGAANAPAITDRGYYMLVWERQGDGSWKMARGFNRSDAPAPGAAPVPGPGGS